jgi:hypothetical protein
VKLTDTGIRDTRIRDYKARSAQYPIGDAACPGLCVRIIPKAIKTFAFAYPTNRWACRCCLSAVPAHSGTMPLDNNSPEVDSWMTRSEY